VYGFSKVTVNLPFLGDVQTWKLVYDGYLFSFFWVLDLASIFSLFFDIDWISTPMGLNLDDASGNTKYAKASQVVRLVRLTRLVRLYRIYTMKRRRQLLKKKIIENAANDGLDIETELKKLDLYAQRDSKLGILLNDSTTKKLIVLILAILFILPLLTATIPNNGPMLMLQTLQYYNKGSFTIGQKQEVISIMLDQFATNQVSQYFDNGLTSYLVYLKMSPSFSDLLVYDSDKFSKARTRDISLYSITEDINGITYEVSAKFDDKRLYRDR